MAETPERKRILRLLVVDDNESQLRTLSAVMQAEGFQVIGCLTASQALEHLARHEIGVAVVDLRLPDLSGTELLQRLQSVASRVHVVIHTAYSSYQSAKDALNLGAFAYVEKTGNPDELVHHVHRAFQARLQRYAEDLESVVAERTREVTKTNEELRVEISQRKRAEGALSKARDALETRVKQRTAELAAANVKLQQEIAERKIGRKVLWCERNNFVNVLETMQDGVCIVNREYELEYVNPALEAQFGPWDGRLCYEYFHGGTAPCSWCRAEEVLAGNTVRCEWSFKNGRTYDAVESPLCNPDGSVSRLKLLRDVTRRKQAEQREAELQAQLAHMGRLTTMGEMASGLAHELNQPLAAIASFAQVAAHMALSGSEEQREKLPEICHDIAGQAYRAGELIRRMRQFVKKIQPQPAPLDFQQPLEEVLSLLRGELRGAGVALQLDLEPSLPPVLADRIQLEQVLLNLMRNAIEAMQRSKFDAHQLSIRAKPRGDCLEVAVGDTGDGIPAERIDETFRTFYSTKAEGMGMGLAICRSIVEAHGGRIRAAGNPERGATFTFTLPVVDIS